VRSYLDQLTDELLDTETKVEGPVWPPPGSYRVGECLRVILNEEWQHRLYVERDFDVLDDR
jgi:hypothetical protein